MNKIAVLSQRLTFEMGEDYHRFISHPFSHSTHIHTHTQRGREREREHVCVTEMMNAVVGYTWMKMGQT